MNQESTPEFHPENDVKLTPGEKASLEIIEIDNKLDSLMDNLAQYEGALKAGGRHLETLGEAANIRTKIQELKTEISQLVVKKSELEKQKEPS